MLSLVQKLFWGIAFILCTAIYLDIPIFRENPHLFEPLILLLFGSLVLVQCIRVRPVLSVTYFELFFLLFALYRVIALTIFGFNALSLASILFQVSLYYNFRNWMDAIGWEHVIRVLLWSFLFLLTVYLLCVLFTLNTYGKSLAYLFVPNTSAFSILLAAQLAFIIPFLTNTKRPVFKWLLLVGIIISLLILVLTKGRSGWMGLITGLAFIAHFRLPNPRLKKRILVYAILIILLALPFFAWYKWDSSAGRVLIYKVSLQIFQDNWLFGIGTGQFQVQYNQYQSDYFAVHDIDSKEALLADNTFYAFNDPLQLLVENGLAGFLLFLPAVIFFVLHAIRSTSRNKPVIISATACLLCIATASLFFYSFHILPVLIYGTFCLALINDESTQKKISLPDQGAKVVKWTFTLIAALLVIHYGFYLQYKVESNGASELARSGFKNASLEKYRALDRSYIKDGATLYQYGIELYNARQLQEARAVLADCKRYYCVSDLYRLSARTVHELGLYEEAEREYKTALYMAPNRMGVRYDLAKYYLTLKDTASAVYWAKSVVHMPVKVPSKTTARLQQSAAAILNVSHRK